MFELLLQKKVSAMASNTDDDYGIVNDHVILFTTIVPTTTTTTTTILMTTSSTSAIMNIEHDNHLPFKHNGTQNNKSERQQQQQQQQEGIESNMTSKNRTELKPDPEYVYFRTTARFWVQRVLVPTIMVIGTVGNVITIMIMTRRRMRSSTNWYLAALAIFDLIYLIFTLILSWKHYPNAHDVDYYLYWYMFPFSMMIADASSNTSVWLTATFTIERYIAVCHPIKGKVICTESRAKKIIFCVVLICVSVTIPTPFEWVVVEVTDTKTNQIRMEAKFSDFGENETYRSIYYQLNVFLFVLLPLVLLVIFNTFLIRSVHQSNQMRTKMVMAKDSPYQPSKNDSTMASSPSSSRQETRITIMLIAVVILFILCQTPNACIMVYNTFPQSEHNPNEEYLLTGLSNIGNFLMALNAAGNFILYCLLSQKYRRTFVNMFCPCLAPNQK
ncbi:hypothetical protein BLOT_007117 [Blomia tropicalis]|nr:hypothetical protein BLOT_007117 [Blomia tropicalis]